MKKSMVIFIGLLVSLAIMLCSCSNPEVDLYREAESHFKKGEYDQAIHKTTRALEVTNGGKWNTWGSVYLLDGSIWLLRARSYVAMGKLDEAISDYKAAISRGNEYVSSTALSSNPKPGAKAEWYRTFSQYFNFLGIAYAKAEKFEDALAQFKLAVDVAGRSVNKVGLTDQLVGNVFGGETGKRKEFAKTVGAYCYNAGLIEEKLGRTSNAKEIAKQLDYDKALVIKLD